MSSFFSLNALKKRESVSVCVREKRQTNRQMAENCTLEMAKGMWRGEGQKERRAEQGKVRKRKKE
jgi:hypothetical protein